MNNDNYERHSHTHCWNNDKNPCGIPLKDHKQCCLCDLTRCNECLANNISENHICDPLMKGLNKIHQDNKKKCICDELGEVYIPQEDNPHFRSCPMYKKEETKPKEEILWCDRQNSSKGKECKCVCHQEDYPLPKDYPTPKKESITVIPSPRIDYCSQCDKEHGYDCPMDNKKICELCKSNSLTVHSMSYVCKNKDCSNNSATPKEERIGKEKKPYKYFNALLLLDKATQHAYKIGEMGGERYLSYAPELEIEIEIQVAAAKREAVDGIMKFVNKYDDMNNEYDYADMMRDIINYRKEKGL